MGTQADLSQYRTGFLIGQGAMGEVFQAKDNKFGRDVAIKFLRASLMSDAEIRARFMREARICGQLNHPNIISVFDYGEDANGNPFIVMELLEGEPLSNRIRRGPVSSEEAIRILRAILSALEKAHRSGVVHRDIKPGNVFMCRDGAVKVMDFGIASAIGESKLTNTGSILGTVCYMSPEQVAGDQLDPRTDLYSAGVVFYEMLYGRVPFEGTQVSMMNKIVHESPVFPDGQPVWVTQFLRKALEKHPAARFQTAEEMARSLPATAVVDPGTDPSVAIVKQPSPNTSVNAAPIPQLAWVPSLSLCFGIFAATFGNRMVDDFASKEFRSLHPADIRAILNGFDMGCHFHIWTAICGLIVCFGKPRLAKPFVLWSTASAVIYSGLNYLAVPMKSANPTNVAFLGALVLMGVFLWLAVKLGAPIQVNAEHE